MSVNFSTILSDKVELDMENGEVRPHGFYRYLDKVSYNSFSVVKKYLEAVARVKPEEDIINNIINHCAYSAKWNKNEQIENIFNVINQLSNHLFVCNKMSGANFIICKENGFFINAIKDLSTFEYINQEGNDTYPVGSIDNKYNVYTTDYIDDDKLLIGYKGKSDEESGGVFKRYDDRRVFYYLNDNMNNYFSVLEIVDENKGE